MRRRHGVAARKRVERDFDARKHARTLQDEMFRIVSPAASPVCPNQAPQAETSGSRIPGS
jgi:hypothetical protein